MVIIMNLVELVPRNMIDLVVIIARNLCENTATDVDLGFSKTFRCWRVQSFEGRKGICGFVDVSLSLYIGPRGCPMAVHQRSNDINL